MHRHRFSTDILQAYLDAYRHAQVDDRGQIADHQLQVVVESLAFDPAMMLPPGLGTHLHEPFRRVAQEQPFLVCEAKTEPLVEPGRVVLGWRCRSPGGRRHFLDNRHPRRGRPWGGK